MPSAAFSTRKNPQRTPEGTPPVLASSAALLDGLFEHPAGLCLMVDGERTINGGYTTMDFPKDARRFSCARSIMT
jgi:hypothetical protein